MTILTRTVLIPTDFIMTTWRPGDSLSRSWADVMADLRRRGELHNVGSDVLRYPDPDLGPQVVLGGNGRVWSGHDAVVGAYMKGVTRLRCAFEFVEA